jgi:hypothetical protein
MLPQQAIQEFKELYKKRYGVELSDQEASHRANNLFNLYKVTYMPDSIIEPELHKKVIIKNKNL